MRRVIVNGANGYVASHFINELLVHDYQVIALVRGNKKFSAKERMEKALFKVNHGNFHHLENLLIFNYSLFDNNFSLTDKQLEQIFSKEADYFHFAATLKYDFKSRAEILATNVKGTESSIKFFSEHATGNSRFFFIGTAYSCGNFSGLFEEKFYPDEDISSFRNYYEQSKRMAENVVKKYIENNGLRGYVIRLSQVVGNHITNETQTDYGIFDFAKMVYNLARRYPGHSVRFKGNIDGTQNLIPINVVVDYLLQTVKTSYVPTIMNFVSDNPIKNIHIVNSLNALLPIKIIPVNDLDHTCLTSPEKYMAAGMLFTGNYTDIDLRFDTTKRNEIITPVTREIDETSVYKMLEYFINSVRMSGART